jgi:SET domain-containing protein
MLLVKTVVKQSPIHGRGVFADQFIPKGTIIWRFSEAAGDRQLDCRLVRTYQLRLRRYLHHFCYLSRHTGKWVWSNDASIYMNHSSAPNTATLIEDGEIEKPTVATRDINVGEELLCNYNEFDKWSPAGWLSRNYHQ